MIQLEACHIRPLGSCSRPAVSWYSRISGHVPMSYVNWIGADGWPPISVFGYCAVHDFDLRRHPETFRGLRHAYSIHEAEVMVIMHS